MRKLSLTLIATALLISGCTTPTGEPSQLSSDVLLRTTGSWNGTPFPRYPEGPPQLTLKKIQIPPRTTLAPHCHQSLSLGYVIRGEVEVETLLGERIIARQGETLAEVVNLRHSGRTGEQPAELLMFEADTPEAHPRLTSDGCLYLIAHFDPEFDSVIDQIQRRLALAETVALHKWDNRQPVQDSTREQQIVANVRLAAEQLGANPDRAAAFFNDQMEANKLIQYSLLSRWHAHGVAPDTPRQDLNAQVRPQLDAIQARLLEQLAVFDKANTRNCTARLAKNIDRRDLSVTQKRALARATGQLCAKF